MSDPALGRRRRVVIDGGFGGLAAARGLRRSSVEVTLVDRKNHHLFQPLLPRRRAGRRLSVLNAWTALASGPSRAG
jgi:NADH dehydrogenase FAD-containing subunit